MDSNKTPSLDSFSIHFYRVCWSAIIKDLLRMIKEFQSEATVGGSTNSTFLALIPKEVKPSSFDHLDLFLCVMPLIKFYLNS